METPNTEKNHQIIITMCKFWQHIENTINPLIVTPSTPTLSKARI